MSIPVVHIKSLKSLQKYSKPGWLYRGQQLAEWNLETSLERLCNRECIPTTDRLAVEQHLLREFQRAFHHYSNHPPAEDAIIEWTSLMQHHGAPTRLLDFTYSIYVAAYFALEDAAKKPCAIWAIYSPKLFQDAITTFNHRGKSDLAVLQEPTQRAHEQVAKRHFFDERCDDLAIVHVTPFRLNERLRAQRGTFVIPANVSQPFMENFQAFEGHHELQYAVKLQIPSASRGQMLEELHAMNISRTSLFPGLDGFARSLGVFHPSFRPDKHEAFRKR